jgi:hypothetical protein
LKDLREVQGMAGRVLGNLLPAAEPIGDDQPVVRGLADCGEEFQFSDGLGDFVVLGVEAKGSGHTAASRGWAREADAEAVEERFLGGHLHDGFVVAMAVEHGFAVYLR